MDQDAKDATGVARSQHKLVTLPHDRSAVSQFLEQPLERVDADLADTQLLVLAADTDAATMIAGVAAHLGAERGVKVVPVTSTKRGARLLRERGAQVVVGSPDDVLPLIQSSTLKLAALRTIVLAWVDEVLGADGSPALETIMADVPREAARVMVVSRIGPEVQQLAERYVRRGLRAAEKPAEDDVAPIAIQYVSVSITARAATLRRLLDELDPARAVVWVRSADSADEAQRALGDLGYAGAESGVRVVHGGESGDAGLVIFYDVPAARSELRAVLGTAVAVPQIVVLALPRQMSLVRSLAGGPVTPLTLGGPGAEARRRDESMRAELRAALEGGLAARELLSLEPLLESYDGVEIAAAALRLLEQERTKKGKRVKTALVDDADVTAVFPPLAAPSPRPTSQRPAREDRAGGGQAGTRIFLTIGERDGIKPGDLVGAIAATASITGANIGKIELRDTHALVEIVGANAAEVAEKITGANIKGRRVVARLERDRPPREEGGRGFGGSGGRERSSGPRGGGDRPRFGGGDRSRGGGEDRPRSARPRSDRPQGDRPRSDRPRNDRPREFDRTDRAGGGGPRRRPEGRGQG